MKECRAVGPNLKTYFYYTNECASQEDVKGVIVIATGIEATGALYDEIGDYLDSKGYAMYAIDEWEYGKTGNVSPKVSYKNWGMKDSYYAAYNIHALSVLAKNEHKNSKIYLLGNDFGAMLSLFLLKEFPEVIDGLITIGWGMPRAQDYGLLCSSWIKKLCLYDSARSKAGHFSKNKRLALRFEKGKYSWLSSDESQVQKITAKEYIDQEGTIRHYFYYYLRKVCVPRFMKLKKCDKATPMLFLSGDRDYLTLKGRQTRKLERYYKRRKFTNVESLTLEGRHLLLFEKNRFENIDLILNWIKEKEEVVEEPSLAIKKNKSSEEVYVVGAKQDNKLKPETDENMLKGRVNKENIFKEAEDDLLIRTNRKEQ